jgi:hypothetical protein
MHLIYFDEVKNNNTSQEYFWLGGIVVPSEKAKEIDELAFMFFCEKANALMKQMSDIGMIIGDRESDSLASKYAEHLSGCPS